MHIQDLCPAAFFTSDAPVKLHPVSTWKRSISEIIIDLGPEDWDEIQLPPAFIAADAMEGR